MAVRPRHRCWGSYSRSRVFVQVALLGLAQVTRVAWVPTSVLGPNLSHEAFMSGVRCLGRHTDVRGYRSPGVQSELSPDLVCLRPGESSGGQSEYDHDGGDTLSADRQVRSTSLEA